jgi:hypothetical protein
MLGADMVRVGMEDSVYVHPHRDEKLQTSAQAVTLVKTIAESLGREIAPRTKRGRFWASRPERNSGELRAPSVPTMRRLINVLRTSANQPTRLSPA